MRRSARPPSSPRLLPALVLASLGLAGGLLVGPHLAGAGDAPPVHADLRAVTSHPSTYVVRFLATGLGIRFNWSAALDNASQWSTTETTLAFVGVVNGTHSYTLWASGEVAAPSFGSVTVRGQDVNLTVAFSPAPGGTTSSSPGPPFEEVVALVVAIVVVVVASVALLAERARLRREQLALQPRRDR